MMHGTDLLWFEDVSPLNEPVLSFPVLGRISMRQFFILGLAGMVSYAVFTSTHGPASAVPVSIGAVLALVRPRVGPAEWMAFSIMHFLLVRSLAPWVAGIPGRCGKKKPAGRLGLAVRYATGQGGEGPRVVAVSDPMRPLRFRLRLAGSAGEPLACKNSQVFFDSAIAGSAVTDSNGELEALVVPRSAGRHRISVLVEGKADPVYIEEVEIAVPEPAR